MVIEAKISAEGLTALRKTLDRYETEARNEVWECFVDLGKRILVRARANAPRSSGALGRGIKLRRRKSRLLVTVNSTQRYSASVELGTGVFYSGKRKQRWNAGWVEKGPPIDGLREWAEAHGLSPWALRRALRKQRGTRPQPFLAPSFRAERPEREIVQCLRRGLITRAVRRSRVG